MTKNKIIFSFCIFSYFSDTSDFSAHKHPHEIQSVSPLPPNSINEVDAVNNNLVIDSHSPRKLSSGNRTMNLHPKTDLTNRTSPNLGRRIHESYARNSTTSVDARLNEWLIKNDIDSTSRTIILDELFAYDDFVYEMEKTDLHRIGLKCGVEVKLWRAILNQRKPYLNVTEEFDAININNVEHINRNQVQCPLINVSETTVASSHIQNCNNNSNCNSYDSSSAHTTSSDDYESCNGSN